MTRTEMEYLIEQLRNADSMHFYWVNDAKWWLRRVKECRADGQRPEARYCLARARKSKHAAKLEAGQVAKVTAQMLEACHD